MIDHETAIDPALEAHLRSVLRAVAVATPGDLDPNLVARTRRRAVRPVTIAAALVVAAGVAAGVLIATSRTADAPAATEAAVLPASPAAPARSTPAASGAVAMVPTAMPTGLSLGGDVMDQDLPFDHIQRRVYARATAPDDASSWINVWFSVDQLEVSCDGQAQTEPFTIGALPAATCLIGGRWLSAVWHVDGVAVDVTASSGVARDELVEFAQSLVESPVAAPASGQPAFDLAPAADAALWTPLAGTDIAAAATVHQTVWFADPTGHPDQGSVQVWTWSGAPSEAQYLIQEPLDIERVQVGGRDAFYGTDGSGNPMSVWWTRADGLVVSVSQTGVLDEAGLIAFAESLQPVDAAGLGAFASAGGFAVVAPTP